MNLSTIILAAGQGTRMRSALPKVLHQVASRPMIGHILTMIKSLDLKDKVVVIGEGMEELEKYIKSEDSSASCVIQKERLGTADAVKVGLKALHNAVIPAKAGIQNLTQSQLKKGLDSRFRGNDKFMDDILVLYGDTPFIGSGTIEKMYQLLQSDDRNALVVLGFIPENPAEYGRLSINNKNELEQIIEFLDCTPKQKKINVCNSGVMMIRGRYVAELLAKVRSNNAKKEYYLTDLVEIARKEKLLCRYVAVDEFEALAVNTQAELARAENVMQNQLRQKFMEQGVALIDPQTVYFAADTDIEAGVRIYPNVFFGNGVNIKSGSVIKSFSHLEGVTAGANVVVGPFARIRPGTVIEADAKIGNFVEIKNSTIGKKSKINHLTYIGDTTMGSSVNVGAGTITCNYDGFTKHKTVISNDASIGANTALIAPVKIGEGAIVAAGSVITEDVEKDALAIARADQKNISGKASYIRRRKSNVSGIT